MDKKEKNKLYMREQRKNNKEHVLRIDTISMWKCKRKLKGDLYEVYDICKNTKECYNCNKKLIHNTRGSTKVCMDHNHITGYFRNVLCNKCNCERGKIDLKYKYVLQELKYHFKKLPNVLNNLRYLH